MDLKLDPYTIGGVIAISAGGYLIIKAYNNYSAVSVWNTIGMITVGSALAWGGVKIFSAKSTGEKKEQTKKIKADVTKAIAAVGEESAEVAAAETNDKEHECHECGREWTRNNGRGCPYGDPTCFLCEKHNHNDCDYPDGFRCFFCGQVSCQNESKTDRDGCENPDLEYGESFNAEFSESQREKLAKKGLALPDGAFPIRNKQDLKNAIQSWGLAKKSNKAPAKKFIKLRAKQLGAMKELPKTW
tara:strand:+ start:837 stop:1568 length:732 start_codon:yes stop_codon:yes gene_type:complete